MNETQAQIVKFMKSEPDGVSIQNVSARCYLSQWTARFELEYLNNIGVLGKSYHGRKAWYKFVREM